MFLLYVDVREEVNIDCKSNQIEVTEKGVCRTTATRNKMEVELKLEGVIKDDNYKYKCQLINI